MARLLKLGQVEAKLRICWSVQGEGDRNGWAASWSGLDPSCHVVMYMMWERDVSDWTLVLALHGIDREPEIVCFARVFGGRVEPRRRLLDW